jgi:hypothetical protein
MIVTVPVPEFRPKLLWQMTQVLSPGAPVTPGSGPEEKAYAGLTLGFVHSITPARIITKAERQPTLILVLKDMRKPPIDAKITF